MALEVYAKPARPVEHRCLQRLQALSDAEAKLIVLTKSPARRVLARLGVSDEGLKVTNTMKAVPDKRKGEPVGAVLPGLVVHVTVPANPLSPARGTRTDAVLVVALPDDSWWASPLYPLPSIPPSGAVSAPSVPPNEKPPADALGGGEPAHKAGGHGQ